MKYLFITIYIINIILYFRHNIHMYQLNYYKPEVQFKWLKNNYALLAVNIGVSLLQIILIYYNYVEIAALIGLLLIIYNFPKKAKKNLVITPRVGRMIIETLIIVLIIIVPLYLFIYNYVNYVLVLIYILTPLLLLFVDYSQRPLNKRINQHFIDDAVRILNNKKDLLVIGITGSYGKTSMKYFLTEFLSTKYSVLMTPGNLNTTLGVVRTIRENLKANHEIFVCEMGATKINDIKEICDLVKPTHGIITSIGPQHLESFKTIENVLITKFELANSLPSDGLLFLNNDNEYLRNSKDSHEVIGYGIDYESTYQATDIKVSEEGLSFKVKGVKFTTKLIGKHNILNILGALTVANKLGIDLKDLVESVRRLEPVPHRLELKTAGNRVIIDDAYNSNPAGSKYALQALGEFSGTKVLITPGMVELGEKEDEYNYEFGVNASYVCDYVFLVNEKQTEAIYKGLIDSKFNKEKIMVFKTFDEAYNKLNDLKEKGKLIILIENDLPDQY